MICGQNFLSLSGLSRPIERRDGHISAKKFQSVKRNDVEQEGINFD